MSEKKNKEKKLVESSKKKKKKSQKNGPKKGPEKISTVFFKDSFFFGQQIQFFFCLGVFGILDSIYYSHIMAKLKRIDVEPFQPTKQEKAKKSQMWFFHKI